MAQHTARDTAADTARDTGRRGSDGSIGSLFADVTSDVQRLVRQEAELARAEVKEEFGRAGKAAGMMGGAGFAGWMVVFFLSLAALFGLGNVMDLGWAGLIVAGGWALLGAALFLLGRGRLRRFSPKPTKTMESLKEDAAWARHPTG
ncbi:phage holin family protein [Streptomyces sp. 3MP-14]|uniref:Phage holin family protein n=1 Tax=Streptomyces mimosae TaxID=2586635 RepID=A0A5N6ARA5_9ACTN|nr:MULTISPECIES: phage holin family protein [Streptomyces]KAB8171144.1 phage holin family protein [Streptomyces mimosae]KAB8179504.1 phage holin family protein [Streptomyces sp. 3MP-14]